MEDKQYVLSFSYGKDSMACLGAIEQLKLPLDRIIHAEVWATDTIPADLPPMMEFKAKADKIIKQRWGISVEHFRANTTYERCFYNKYQKGKHIGEIWGFPCIIGAWCNSRLKVEAINKATKSCNDSIHYIGIAEDEPERLKRLDGINKISPLHLMKWTEADCMEWCIKNDLRSPLYDSSNRGGCWFCHNQNTEQLRLLRKNYPQYWNILMKWDEDSLCSFKPNSITLHDYDKRFQYEDEGWITKDDPWKWIYLKFPPCKQLSLFD